MWTSSRHPPWIRAELGSNSSWGKTVPLVGPLRLNEDSLNARLYYSLPNEMAYLCVLWIAKCSGSFMGDLHAWPAWPHAGQFLFARIIPSILDEEVVTLGGVRILLVWTFNSLKSTAWMSCLIPHFHLWLLWRQKSRNTIQPLKPWRLHIMCDDAFISRR